MTTTSSTAIEIIDATDEDITSEATETNTTSITAVPKVRKPINRLLAELSIVASISATGLSMQGTGIEMSEICYSNLNPCKPELTGVVPSKFLRDLKNQPQNSEINEDAVLRKAKVLRVYRDNPARVPFAMAGLALGLAGYLYAIGSKKDSIYNAPSIRAGYEVASDEAQREKDSTIALAKARARVVTATRLGILSPAEIEVLASYITPVEYREYGWALDSGKNGWKFELLEQNGYTGGINLYQLNETPIEALMPQPQEAVLVGGADSTPSATSEDKETLRSKALNIRDALVSEADKSKLGGCVILAAPGAGKTTFLGSAWGRLKATYGSSFKAMAVVVKRSDVEAFKAATNDNAFCVKSNPRLVAIEILKFINDSMAKHGQVRRLFLDDFITMWTIFKTSLSGVYVNPETFQTYSDKREDIDAQPLLQTLDSALNEMWLVGREFDSALWVSSHSGNVDALPFVGSRESRSVGQLIYLGTSDKREFIEQTLNNPNLIADNTKRQQLKTTLDSLKDLGREPLVLANYDNWTLGIVPQLLRAEYENYRILWESECTQPPADNHQEENTLDALLADDELTLRLKQALLELDANQTYKISTIRRDKRAIKNTSNSNQQVRDAIAQLVKEGLADYEPEDCFLIV
jgi:hypothetical protein